MKKHLVLSSILFLFALLSSAQTGPGGVGNSSNNILWLDASDIILSDNDPVSNWQDISGNFNHAVQATSSRQPIFKINQINGNPSIEFDGTNDYLDLSSNITTGNITLFTVYNKTPSDLRALFATSKHILFAEGHRATMIYDGPETRYRISKPNESFSVMSMQTDASVSGTSLFLSNGGTTKTVTRNSTYSLTTSSVGSRNFLGSHSLYFEGQITEILVYNEVLNTAKRRIVSEYLGGKYGLTSEASLYSYSTDYGYNIIGLGQESDGSHTEARGFDSLLVNNASSIGNGDYIIIGSDSAGYARTSDVPLGFVERWTQVWKAEVTGTPGTVDVRFYLGSNDFATESTYALLIENGDGDFTNGGTSVHPGSASYDVGTNSVLFTGVSFSSGDHFTLAETSGAITATSSGTWKTPGIWNCVCIPDSSDVVNIPSPFNVSIDSNASIATLSIASGASLSIAGTDTLQVFKDVSFGSAYTLDNGTIAAVSESDAQTFSNTSGSVVALNNLYVANTSGLSLSSGEWTVKGNLQVSSGGLDVSGSTSVTLLSDASSTSQILESMSGGFTGDFTIERFIAARNAGYSNISSPTTNMTVADLDDDLFLSGVGGLDGNANISGGGIFRSMYAFDRTADQHDTIKTINTILQPTEGYEVYLATTASTFNATTVDVTGVPNSGTLYTTKVNINWNLLGNPYHAFIAWDSVNKPVASIPDDYYIFNTDNGSYDFFTGSGKPLIAPFQGFWVFKPTGGGHLIPFQEEDKVSSSTSVFLRKKNSYFSLKLTDLQNSYNHKTNIKFSTLASNDFDEGDSPFLTSPLKEAPAIYSIIDSDFSQLTMNNLNSFESSHIVPITVYSGTFGKYKMSTEGLTNLLDYYSCVYLEDQLNNEVIDLSVEDNYEFESNPGTSERFRLIISNSFEECEKAMNDDYFSQNLNEKLSLRNVNNTWFIDYKLSEESIQLEVEVINMKGQRVISPILISASHSGTYRLNQLDELNGFFIIRIKSNNQIQSKTIKL